MWACNIERRHGEQGALVQTSRKSGTEIGDKGAEQKERFGIPRCRRARGRIPQQALPSLLVGSDRAYA